MGEPWQRMLELVLRHRGKIIGILVGWFVGRLVLAYGLVRALFLLACVAVGFRVGKEMDSTDEDVIWRRSDMLDAARRRKE